MQDWSRLSEVQYNVQYNIQMHASDKETVISRILKYTDYVILWTCTLLIISKPYRVWWGKQAPEVFKMSLHFWQLPQLVLHNCTQNERQRLILQFQMNQRFQMNQNLLITKVASINLLQWTSECRTLKRMYRFFVVTCMFPFLVKTQQHQCSRCS